MLIPSKTETTVLHNPSLSRRVNANSQPCHVLSAQQRKLIKKGEC